MKKIIQHYLCVLLLAANIGACASQQEKPRLKARPAMVQQMAKGHDFKVSFPMYTPSAGGWAWSFLGAEVPFYMQIWGDTLYSFMDYDVWTRPGLGYVYARPEKHGKPFPSKYIISNYEVTTGARDSTIIKFTFPMHLNLSDGKIFIPRNEWFSLFLEEPKVYEIKAIPVRCKMAIARNGDASVYFIQEKEEKVIAYYTTGYFVFNPVKK